MRLPTGVRHATVLFAAAFLLSTGREALPGYACAHHGGPDHVAHDVAADGHHVHAEPGAGSAAPVSEPPGPPEPCDCLDQCLTCSPPAPVGAGAAAAVVAGGERSGGLSSAAAHRLASRSPYLLPFALPPPPLAS